jgi:hypothetical protein
MANSLGVTGAQTGLAGLSTTPATTAPSIETNAPGLGQNIPANASPVAQRLISQGATMYAPGLAQVPLPKRDADVPRTQPKKEASPMKAARTLDGGRSPLAPESLQDAAAGTGALGAAPGFLGEESGLGDAKASASKLPSANGMAIYTKTSRGDQVYLPIDRMQHVLDVHVNGDPSQRGKRSTTYWPVKHAIAEPSMTEQDVTNVTVDAIRKGTMRNEVRDTRMIEYELPNAQADKYGVSEVKVSLAPDGLVLSAYPSAGDNVFATYEVNPADQAALEAARAKSQTGAADEDTRMFKTNVAQTTFG